MSRKHPDEAKAVTDSRNSAKQASHSERPGVWDSPKNVQILIWSFWACCALVFALDLVFHRHASFEHGDLPIESMFGFYSLYGFVACVLLVLIAKQMRKVLMRGEDYYEPLSHLEDATTSPQRGADDE